MTTGRTTEADMLRSDAELVALVRKMAAPHFGHGFLNAHATTQPFGSSLRRVK